MKKKEVKKGFTLIEILIAISIFAIVISLSTNIYISVTREHKRANLQNAIYEDARLMLEKITNLVKQHQIDYEEYYSQLVVQSGVDFNDKTFGLNYGKYGSQFYDPGFSIKTGNQKQGTHPEDLGAECGDGTALEKNPDCVIYIPSLDTNSGKNPYNLSDISETAPDLATAFCNGNCAGAQVLNEQEQLYIISGDGTRKIILARELTKVTSTSNEFSLAMAELIGTDTDNNGVVDEYVCDAAKGFTCPSDLPSNLDLSNTSDASSYSDQDFVPISSKDIHVKSLKFIIAPLEDPRKAFQETTGKVQIQPHVTIILEVEPTEKAMENLNIPDKPSLFLQSTVTPNLYKEVKSFPPCQNMLNFKDANKDCLGN